MQSKWEEMTEYGCSLRLSFNRKINKEHFTECVDYLYNESDGREYTHLFYTNQHIYVFYEDAPHSNETFKKKLTDRLRAGWKLSKDDYDVQTDYLDEMEGIDGFDSWLRELLSRSDDQVKCKSRKLADNFVRDFIQDHGDEVGQVKIDRKIAIVNDQIDKLDAEDAQLDHEELELDKPLNETNNRLTKLDEMEQKYVRLLEQCKEKASKLQERKQVIQEKKDLVKKRKDEEAAKQKKVEKWKKIAIETAVCELFRFTPSELGSRNYVSKQVICDLLGLDCTSQKDMRYLSNILKDYGVVYDRFKTQDKVKGCFQFLQLK